MPTLDLSRFGFACQVDLHGTVETSWSDGDRVVFLFGENHRDRDMKRLNVLDACQLINAGVVGCVGTEERMTVLDRLQPEDVKGWSTALFAAHGTDEGVIDYLKRTQPGWYGDFEFGSAIRVLRPSLPVRCVEDLALHAKVWPLLLAYEDASLGFRPHPCPEFPTLDDHPDSRQREEAMIRNLLTLWNLQPTGKAAVLNTGLDHSRRIAAGLRERDINHCLITRPGSADLYQF